MKALIKIHDPSKVEVSLTLTMKLEDWKVFKNQLLNDHGYPVWKIESIIGDLIIKAQESFESVKEIDK